MSVDKEAEQKSETGELHLKTLSEVELRQQYQIKISNSFAALENLNNSEDINRPWQNVKENLGLYEHT